VAGPGFDTDGLHPDDRVEQIGHGMVNARADALDDEHLGARWYIDGSAPIPRRPPR